MIKTLNILLALCLPFVFLYPIEPPSLAGEAGLRALSELFLDQQHSLFLHEAEAYLQKNPRSPSRAEVDWMRGQALLRLKRPHEARLIFLSLTNNTKEGVRHRALFDLAEISSAAGLEVLAQSFLEQIAADPTRTSVHEAAVSRLLLMKFTRGTAQNFQKSLANFTALYPHSPILSELYYFAALTELNNGNVDSAEEYGKKVQGRKGDTFQRLLAEIALQKKDYQGALAQFEPLSQKEGVFQDEALYKTGLIYKLSSRYESAAQNFRRLVSYFPNSAYRDRSLAELASVDVILKNYDQALAYYRRESGFSGSRKANALLKITEIYFVKGDSRSTIRAANRIQRDFPYSIYANEALYWQARTALNDKQFAKSIDIFNTYLIREPLSPKKDEILIFLGQAFDNLGDPAEARRRFQTVVRDTKDSSALHNALMGIARSYSRENQTARSLEFYDRIWQSKAALPALREQALYFAGASRYNLRQNAEAADNLKRLNKEYPKGRFYQDALLLLVRLNFKNEDFESILAQEEPSFADAEALSEFRELQARSEFRLERYESSLSNFQEARRLTKNKERQTALFLAEAGALRNLGRRREALRFYERYMNENKEIEEILWNEIILTSIEAGDLPNAVEKLEQFSEAAPRSPYRSGLYFKLGDEYFTQGRPRQAAAFYQKARLSADRKDQKAEAALREGWSLDSSGRYLEASEAFTVFLAQNGQGGWDAAPVLSRLAEYNDRRGDFAAARKLRKEILEKYSSSPEADKARGQLASAIPLSSTESVFREEAAKSEDTGYKAHVLYRLSQKFENEQNTGRLLGTLWEIQQLNDPVLAGEASLKMAQVTLKEGDPRGALNLFIAVITEHEKHRGAALLGVVESYIALGDHGNAARFTDRLEEQFPDTPPALRARALMQNTPQDERQ